MKQKAQKNYDYNLRFTEDDIKKQVEALQSKDTQNRWRLQYSQKYRPSPLIIGDLNQSRGSQMRQTVVQKNQRQNMGKTLSPMNQVELSINSTNIQDSRMITKQSKSTQESILSPISKPLIAKESLFFSKQKTPQKLIKKRMKNSGEFQPVKTQISEKHQTLYTNNETSAGVQSLRHRNQNVLHNSRSFSLVDLKNNFILNSPRGKQEIGKLLGEGWKESQVLYTVQNEIGREFNDNSKSLSPQIISNENQLRHTKFGFAMTTRQKEEKDLKHEKLKPLPKNSQNYFSTSPKHNRHNAKMFPNTASSYLFQTVQSPPSHPHKEYGEFFPSQFLIQNSRKSSPKVSLSDLEIHRIDSNSLQIPQLQIYQKPKSEMKQQKPLKKQSMHLILSRQKSTQQKAAENNINDLLNQRSPPKLDKKQILTEGNIPLSKQSSSKDLMKRQESNHFDAFEDWEIPHCYSITDSINKYYSSQGKQHKQAQILKHQEQLLEKIERTQSIHKVNSNIQLSNQESVNQSSQHSLQPSEGSVRIHIKRDQSGNDKNHIICKNNISQTIQTRTDKLLTEISPLNQTGLSMNGSKTERDCSPITSQKPNIWVSSSLPFQNTSYDKFSQSKKPTQKNISSKREININHPNHFANINSPNTTKSSILIKNSSIINHSFHNNNNNSIANSNKNQMSITDQIFGKTNSITLVQIQKQTEDYSDEVIGDNQNKKKQESEEEEEQQSNLSNRFSQVFKHSGFNKTLLSSSPLRLTINDRFKNNSQKEFEKQITDKKLEQTKRVKETVAFATFKGFVSFKFGKNKNKDLIVAQDKERFKQFLKFQDKRPLGSQLPKDTHISNIMPSFKLHEMKFLSKSTIFGDKNENLQMICQEGYMEHENDKHNLLQYEDSYLLQQAEKLKYDLLSYREYKDQNKVNDYSKRKYDGWFGAWAKKVDKQFKQSDDDFRKQNQGLNLLKKIDQMEEERLHKIRDSLLSTLMKFIKLNLTLKEVYVNKLFVRGQIIRKSSHQFIEAVKSDDQKEFNTLINEDKYLVYSTDYLLQTPLHWAAKRGNKQLLISLIKLKADIEARDIFGRTPLYYAYREGKQEIAIILMRNKACPWSDKQNDISKYANHPTHANIYRFYRISKKVILSQFYLNDNLISLKKMHLMLIMSPYRQRLDIWKDFKNHLDNIY